MHIKPNSKQADNIPPIGSDLSEKTSAELDMQQLAAQTELIQALLHEILRVKELINTYNNFPSAAKQFNVRILEELVSAARESLFNYDTVLMKKYYDLLKDCD